MLLLGVFLTVQVLYLMLTMIQTVAYPEGDDIILYVDVNWDLYDSANLLYYTVGGVYHSRPQQGPIQGFSTIMINNVRGDSVCVFYFSGRRIGLTTDISVPVVKLQPNPAASFATITIEGANGEVDYSLIDLSGRIIRHKTVNAVSAERIDLLGLANGTYFVRVTNESFSRVEKLVISN